MSAGVMPWVPGGALLDGRDHERVELIQDADREKEC